MNKKYNFDEVIDRTGTNSIKYDFRERFFGNKDVMPLWVADMDFKTPDFVIEALRNRLNHEVLGYTFRSEGFTKSVKAWMKRQHNWQVKDEWITFSPGVVPALSMAVLAFSEPGDQIIVQPPVYHPFFSVIKGNKRKVLENPLILSNGIYKMELDDLKSKITHRTSMILLSNPHNPGGNVWTHDELEKLASICLENNILIMADEIHSDLVFEGHFFTPVASISKEIAKNTVTFMAPSKTFNLAGLASSVIIIPDEEVRKRYNDVLETMHLYIGNLFGLIGLETAYTLGDDWLKQLLDYLKSNRDFLVDFIHNKTGKLDVIVPEGTYMAWIDFRNYKLEDEEIRRILIEEAGIGLNHGPMFGTGGSGFQRLNFACPKAILEDALNKIEGSFAKYE